MKILNIPKLLYYSLVLLVLSFAFSFFTDFEQDYDLWMHLFFGKITSLEGIARADTFSFTASGSPIVNHEWLSQALLYQAYDLFGDTGIIFYKFIFFVGILFFTWKLLNQNIENRFVKVALFFLLLVTLRSGISFRIQLFSYFFLLLLIYFEETKLKDSLRLVLYPLLFLIWANIHGAFVLGLGVLGVYELQRFITNKSLSRSSLIVFSVSILVTLINPYCYKLWLYIFHELTLEKSSEFITEWQSFAFQPREMGFLILLIVSWLGLIFTFKSNKLSSLILLIVATYLGLNAVRHTPLLAILGLPVLIHTFSRFQLKEIAENSLSKISALGVSIIAIFIFFNSIPRSFNIVDNRDPLPKELVDFVERNNLSGNMFLPLHWGGYVLFTMAPEIKVSIDGRWATTYPTNIMKLNNQFYYQSTAQEMLEIAVKNKADYMLLESSHPEIADLSAEKKLQLIAKNPVFSLFKLR